MGNESKILVVDDQREVCDVLREALTENRGSMREIPIWLLMLLAGLLVIGVATLIGYLAAPPKP